VIVWNINGTCHFIIKTEFRINSTWNYKNKFCINPRSGLKNPKNSQLLHGKSGNIWHLQCPINYRRLINLQITWFWPPIFSNGNFSEHSEDPKSQGMVPKHTFIFYFLIWTNINHLFFFINLSLYIYLNLTLLKFVFFTIVHGGSITYGPLLHINSPSTLLQILSRGQIMAHTSISSILLI